MTVVPDRTLASQPQRFLLTLEFSVFGHIAKLVSAENGVSYILVSGLL